MEPPAPHEDEPRAPAYTLTRWLFLRLLGVVFLIAFVSYWVQLDGLIGAKGILPAASFMQAARSLGAWGVLQVPTLCWLGASDAWLHSLAAAGTLLSLLLLAGAAAGPVLLLLWALYLSLVVVGQTFYTFQWDILLLEAALTSLFLAPWTLRALPPWTERGVPRGGVWLLRTLLFKLMFLSGIVKLVCLDPTWWGWTALDYHYYTQPLPVWTSWYAHHLPHVVNQASVAIMFAIELGAPFLLFFPRRARLPGVCALILLQCLIAGTGNYGFFNLLTVVLCVACLDDGVLLRLLPAGARARLVARMHALPSPTLPASHPRRVAYAIVAGVFLYASSLCFVQEIVRTRPPGQIGGVAGKLLDAGAVYVAAGEGLLGWIGPFRSISGYGLFRAMTTTRPEIVIETSDDGEHWREVRFRYKPGDVLRRPRFVAPHQPRLDWQMWFAALNPRRAGPWLEGLLRGILEGSPHVLGLIGDPALHGAPPRFVRLVSYEYWFTTRAEAAASGGAWWRRERRGEMTAALSRESLR